MGSCSVDSVEELSMNSYHRITLCNGLNFSVRMVYGHKRAGDIMS